MRPWRLYFTDDSAVIGKGIVESGGIYVAFIDGDDWYLPSKLELQAAFLDQNPPIGLVNSGWRVTDEMDTRQREIEAWKVCPQLELSDWLLNCPAIVNSV